MKRNKYRLAKIALRHGSWLSCLGKPRPIITHWKNRQR